MHELSLVEDLLSECQRQAAGRVVLHVRVRCPAGVDREELALGFAFLGPKAGPGLRGAALEVVDATTRLECTCGFRGDLGPDDVAGHMGICPGCGRVSELGSRVELLSLTCEAAAR